MNRRDCQVARLMNWLMKEPSSNVRAAMNRQAATVRAEQVGKGGEERWHLIQ